LAAGEDAVRLGRGFAGTVMLVCVIAGFLYGSTYQQFRHFDASDPRGISDWDGYVAMSHGQFGPPASDVHRYRPVVPWIASLVRPLLPSSVTRDERERLPFYLTNFFFSLAAAVLLFQLLLVMHFEPVVALVGVAIFTSSRITVLATATPLTDSYYFASIAAVLLCTVANRAGALAMVLPMVVLSKETIVPFMLLPLLTGLRRSRLLYAGYAAAAAVLIGSRMMIEARIAPAKPFAEIAAEHLANVGTNLAALLSLRGVHDLSAGYSLFLPLAIVGYLWQRRRRSRVVPLVLDVCVTLALALGLLSGNFGRLFFSSFPAVIAYALTVVSVRRGAHQAEPPNTSST
jgi:hypothetical protein